VLYGIDVISVICGSGGRAEEGVEERGVERGVGNREERKECCSAGLLQICMVFSALMGIENGLNCSF
jgi:hypothetical protein